jgi:hypothetical protein
LVTSQLHNILKDSKLKICVVLKIWPNTFEDSTLSFAYITVRSFTLPVNFRHLVAPWRLTLISTMIGILMKKEEINWKGNMQQVFVTDDNRKGNGATS